MHKYVAIRHHQFGVRLVRVGNRYESHRASFIEHVSTQVLVLQKK
jgi:hypothetical protein